MVIRERRQGGPNRHLVRYEEGGIEWIDLDNAQTVKFTFDVADQDGVEHHPNTIHAAPVKPLALATACSLILRMRHV